MVIIVLVKLQHASIISCKAYQHADVSKAPLCLLQPFRVASMAAALYCVCVNEQCE